MTRVWLCNSGTPSFRPTEDLCLRGFSEFKEFEKHMATVHDCRTCAEEGNFKPSHYALDSCRSGKRAHCTCDGCF